MFDFLPGKHLFEGGRNIEPGANLLGLDKDEGGNGGDGADGDGARQALGMGDLRDLALRSMANREGLYGTELGRQQQLAGGSPAALTSTLLPQITALRQRLEGAFDQLNRRLGPTAGKQGQAARGAALEDAGKQLQALFAGGQRQGLQQLFQMLSGLNLSLYPAPTTTTAGAFDPSQYQALGQNVGLLLGKYLDRNTTPQGSALGAGVPAGMQAYGVGSYNPGGGVSAYGTE